MRNLFVCFLFVSTLGYSQISDFNLSDYKAYKMNIGNVTNREQAVFIENTMEKKLISEFSCVDFSTGISYFIVKKNENVSIIELTVNNLNGFSCSNSKEISLDKNLFLELYFKRAATKNEDINNQPPNYIVLNGNEKKSEILYVLAKEIWVQKHPNSYNALYNIDSKSKEFVPEHYPKFINTGNVEIDSKNFDNAKKEWINQYPNEYNKMCGILKEKN